MLGGRASIRALAIVSFPVRPGALDPYDALDLALALQQVGRSIAAGDPHTGTTIIVPYQERTTMKVSIDLTGPNGKMWELDMQYHKLPPEYVAEIAAVAQSYAVYIKNLPGQAGSQEPSYAVSFKYEAEGEELKGVAEPLLSVYKPKEAFRAVRLLYSQAIEVQDAGIALLTQLQAGAHREIKSGQRK